MMKACWFLTLMLLVCTTVVDAKVVQQNDSMSATVTDGYGKRISGQIKLVYVYGDATPNPKPVIVLNHGRSAKQELRASLEPSRGFAGNARWLAQLGFFVVIPTRIGYGQTGGEDVEHSGDCNRKNYPPGYQAAAEQTMQNGFADMQWNNAQANVCNESLLNEAFRENYRPSGFAAIQDITAPPGLNENCRKRYEEWLKKPSPIGFAIARDGGCGFSDVKNHSSADLPTDPAERALIVCQIVRDRPCRLYAIDDQVVWTPQ